MQKTRLHTSLSFILCMVLIAAMALFATGCNGNETTAEDSSSGLTLPVKDGAELGEGDKTIDLIIADKDGNETHVTVHTDKTIVGEALEEIGLLEGEEGPYGLFIKKVNGISADYDKDGVYWAFYVNGEYAMEGIDQLEIDETAAYALRVEK